MSYLFLLESIDTGIIWNREELKETKKLLMELIIGQEYQNSLLEDIKFILEDKTDSWKCGNSVDGGDL